MTPMPSPTLAANVENLTYTGAAAFAGIGNNLANVATGCADADTLTGPVARTLPETGGYADRRRRQRHPQCLQRG